MKPGTLVDLKDIQVGSIYRWLNDLNCGDIFLVINKADEGFLSSTNPKRCLLSLRGLTHTYYEEHPSFWIYYSGKTIEENCLDSLNIQVKFLSIMPKFE